MLSTGAAPQADWAACQSALHGSRGMKAHQPTQQQAVVGLDLCLQT